MNTKIELIWLADKLDRVGMTAEANTVDSIIKSAAGETKIFGDDPEPGASPVGGPTAEAPGEGAADPGEGTPTAGPEVLPPGDPREHEGKSIAQLMGEIGERVTTLRVDLVTNEEVNLDEEVQTQLDAFTSWMTMVLWHLDSLVAAQCREEEVFRPDGPPIGPGGEAPGPDGPPDGPPIGPGGEAPGPDGPPVEPGGEAPAPDPEGPDTDEDDEDEDDETKRWHGPGGNTMTQSVKNVGNIYWDSKKASYRPISYQDKIVSNQRNEVLTIEDLLR